MADKGEKKWRCVCGTVTYSAERPECPQCGFEVRERLREERRGRPAFLQGPRRVSFLLSAEEYRALKRYSEERGEPVSVIIREALVAFLREGRGKER